MRRRATAAIAALLCATLLTACGNPREFSGDETLSAGVTRSKDYTLTYNYADGALEPPTSYVNYTSGATALAFKQFRALSETETGSFVFSPASSVLQLGMLANAASADTRQEILAAMGGLLTLDDLNACSSYFKSRMEAVSRAGQKEEPAETVTLGGALLVDQSADVKTSFLQTEKNFYGYDVFRCDFGGEYAADKLGAYLKPYISDSGIDLTEGGTLKTVSYAAVSDLWLDAGSTQPGTFHGKNGAQTAEFFTSDVKLLHSGKATGVLKYTAKNPLKLLLVLPDDEKDFDGYLEHFDSAELNALLDSMDITKQKAAAIPSFSVGTDKKAAALSDSLTKSGLFSLFTEKSGFSALSYTQEVSMGEMYEIPCGFSLNQNGINTGSALAAANSSETAEASVSVDRPFLFLLLDNESNLPVLMGRYE